MPEPVSRYNTMLKVSRIELEGTRGSGRDESNQTVNAAAANCSLYVLAASRIDLHFPSSPHLHHFLLVGELLLCSATVLSSRPCVRSRTPLLSHNVMFTGCATACGQDVRIENLVAVRRSQYCMTW